MKLMDFVCPSCIAAELDETDKEKVLRRMVDMLAESGFTEDPAKLLHSLLEREKIMTTGIGHGIAVPHTVCEDVKAQTIALAHIPQGADFDSLDREPVFFVFLLVGPPSASATHLKTLARISRLVQHTDFVNAIKQANAVDDILNILAEEDGKHSG
ncbi:MAG: PTS sugar transporter subunit IIA [Candidatus Glassbacteria bacterium]|nr:PTS sugar transporter subunit IIA [Candidatus Glassbacteria bacterium]